MEIHQQWIFIKVFHFYVNSASIARKRGLLHPGNCRPCIAAGKVLWRHGESTFIVPSGLKKMTARGEVGAEKAEEEVRLA